MPNTYGNRIKVSTSTTGTGTITLGSAVDGFQTFSSGGITDGNTVAYVIEDGSNFEIGTGTYTASGTTLTRTVSESTNSNNAISLSGDAVVFIAPSASDLPFTDGASFSGAVTFAEDVTFDGATAGRDILFDRSENKLNFAPDAKLTFGNSDELTISRIGSGGVQAIVSGYMAFKSDTDMDFQVSNSDRMTLRSGGRVDLYYSGSKKFETASDGINVIGTVTDDGAVHDGDVTFTGASYSAVWDKSDNSLEFADDARVTFGTGGDLIIYHDSSTNKSHITESGSSHLVIQGQEIQFDNAAGTSLVNMSASQVELLHSGSTKFTTESTGIAVTGNIVVSGTVDGRDLAVDGLKLDGIEADADVTDAANVAAAGAALTTGATFTGDVTFTGDSYNAVWDKSDNALEFADNAQLTFGAGTDLFIKSDGSNSIIQGAGTTYLRGSTVIIGANGGSGGFETGIRVNEISSETSNVELYCDNSKKLETTSSGVTVTGSIANSSGDMTVDVAGDIILDAGADIVLKEGGSTYAKLQKNGLNPVEFFISHEVADGQLKIRGNDGGSTINALIIDMADAGTASFNHDIKLYDNGKAIFGTGGDLEIYHSGSDSFIKDVGDGALNVYSNAVDFFNAAGSERTARFIGGGSNILFNAGAIKLQTSSTGVTISGTLAATAVTGDGSGLTNLPAQSDSTKMPLSGGTFTGDVTFNEDLLVGQNDKLWLGYAGSANTGLQLFHGGTSATIENHNFVTTYKSDGHTFKRHSTDREYMTLNEDTNHTVSLKAGGSTKLQTSGTGVTVTGTLAATAITGDGSGLTNVSASDSAKMPLAGGTFTGDVTFDGDAANIIFDKSHDALDFRQAATLKWTTSSGTNRSSILYDGTRTTWTNLSDYPIRIDGSFEVVSGSSSIASFETTGVDLYYSNSKKFETTSAGVTISGTATATSFSGSGANLTNLPFPSDGGSISTGSSITFADNADLKFGTAEDLIISHENVGGEEFNRFYTINTMVTRFQGDYEFGHTSGGSGGDVTFKGASYNVVWDRSDNALEFADNAKATFGDGALQIYSDGTTSYIQENASGNLIVYASDFYINESGGTNMFHAAASGGTTLKYQGSSKLQTVHAGVNVTGTLSSTGDVIASGKIGLDTTDYITFTNNTQMDVYINNSNEFRFEADGDFHADGNVIAYSTTISDERLKKDIKPITGALDKVGQLNGYTFTYKADGKESAGVIAQEIEAVLPSAVTETTLPLKTDDGVEYKTVQYDQLHGLLIEAIKELKAEIEELKNGSTK